MQTARLVVRWGGTVLGFIILPLCASAEILKQTLQLHTHGTTVPSIRSNGHVCSLVPEHIMCARMSEH